MPAKHTQKFVESAYLKKRIILLSIYQGANHKNDLGCLICKYEWKSTYKSFQDQNSGCPKCNKSIKNTHEFAECEYLKANIKLLSFYITNKVKNNLLCLICDYKWKATFDNFISKHSGCPECVRLSNIGKGNPNWNHELTNKDRENSYNRNLFDNRLWIKLVLNRDNYTCQCCNIKGCTLNAHHINSWSKFKDDRFNVDNGVTLCQDCHNYYHSIFVIDKVNYKTFYTWIVLKSVINHSNWSWVIRYPDAMAKRLSVLKL